MSNFPVDVNNVKKLPRYPIRISKRSSSRSIIVTQAIQSNLPTDGITYFFGQYLDVGNAEKISISLGTSSFTKGPLTGLKCIIQGKSFNGSDYNIAVDSLFPANPFTADPAASFTQIFANFILPSGLQLIRVGFTCTATHTSGQISAILNITKS